MQFESTRQHRHQQCRPAGFSFAEVLFAVAVLGIGFIMVAAIFPVAIQQTQLAMDETVGTATARNGIAYVQGTPFMTSKTLPYTAPVVAGAAPGALVYSFFDPRVQTNSTWGPTPVVVTTDQMLWNSVKKSLIVQDDPRFAVIPLYSRDNGGTFAKVFIFAVRIRNRDQWRDVVASGTSDVDRTVADTVAADLEPRPVKVTLTEGNTDPDLIAIDNITNADDANLGKLSTGSNAREAAGEGAYVVISDDRVPDNVQTAFGGAATPAVNEAGRSNGRVYKLGAARPDLGPYTFELAPGGDMTCSAGADGKFGTFDDITENIPWRPVGKPPAGSANKEGFAFLIGRGYGSVPGGYAGGVVVVQHYENVVSLP